MKNINNRISEYDINDIFLKRFSPRAMSGEVVSKEDVSMLVEAARWAPSASNTQPSRYLYALRGTPDFDTFLSFLVEANQTWCKNAGAFLILLSRNVRDEGKPNPTHSFYAGASWENLALQGVDMNLVIHAMAGYNGELLRSELNIPAEYSIEVMIAIGKPGKIEDLPEKYQEREAPSLRKPLEEILFEGKEGATHLK